METKWKLLTTPSFFLFPLFSQIKTFKQSDAHLFIEIPGKERRKSANMGQCILLNNQHTPTLIVSAEIFNFQTQSLQK